jgi:uncharacterized protein (TIGR03435 family)
MEFIKALMLLSMIACAGHAQSPAFEVASIKPSRSLGGVSSMHPTRGRITMENVSLKKVILAAYGIPDDRDYAISGPGWLGTERFDIDATFPADTAAQQMRLMMQTLLADRFRLALHGETRQLPVYALVVAKNGPKIHAVEAGQLRTSGGAGKLEATKITMVKLADMLGRLAGLPVQDSTGLQGVFDFTLEWSPDEALKMTPADESAKGTGAPSVFTAIQEQLGLRLDSRKRTGGGACGRSG